MIKETNKMEENWLKQAEADLKTANNSFNSGDYYASAFWCQQAVEKALKFLLLKEKRKLVKTHSVVRLAKLINAPKELIEKIAIFEPIHQEARYPDVSPKIPVEEFEEDKTKNILGLAKEVIEWIKKKKV